MLSRWNWQLKLRKMSASGNSTPVYTDGKYLHSSTLTAWQHGSDTWQCSRCSLLVLRCRSDVVQLVERLHKVVVLDAAALALHSTTVLAVVLQRRRDGRASGGRGRRAGATQDRLTTLLALQTCVAARRRGKHVVRVHCANEQHRAGPRSTAASAPQRYWWTIHASTYGSHTAQDCVLCRSAIHHMTIIQFALRNYYTTICSVIRYAQHNTNYYSYTAEL